MSFSSLHEMLLQMRRTKIEEVGFSLPDIKDSVTFTTPARNQLEMFFLYFSKIMHDEYRQEIQAISCSWLSSDHTFKISKLVKVCSATPSAAEESCEPKCKKAPKTDQFSACLFCLNELGQVASFCLTRTTSYAECSDVIADLCERKKPSILMTGNNA